MRRQLVIALLIGILFLCGIAGGGLYFYLRRTLTAQFDAALRVRAEALAACVHLDRNHFNFSRSDQLVQEFAVNEADHGAQHRASYFEIWYPDGRVYARSDSLGRGDLQRRQTGEAATFDDLSMPDGRIRRLVWLHFHPQPADADDLPAGPNTIDGLWLAVAESRRPIDEPLDDLLGGMGYMAGALALAASALVWIMVRRGMRPLAQVADAASRIDASSLGYRFDDSKMPPELSPICKRLNDLLARLDAAFERERRFTSDVAHELRTPIAELRTLAEVALRWPQENPSSALADALAIAQHMERMVTSLLALSRCESGKIVAHPANLDWAQLLADAWRPLKAQAERRKLAMRIEVPAAAPAHSDPDLLASIVSNLLANALQYSPASGEMACALKIDNGKTTLTISNRAEDLRAEDLPHLCEPFWRKSEARSPDEHSGLGLALVKAYAAVIGAQIDFTLSTEKVFTVSVTLPTAESTATVSAPAAATATLLLLLGMLIAPATACAADGDLAESFPFMHQRDGFNEPAMLDLRDLNEKTAGESGFVHESPDGNGFVRGDGAAIRFWACVVKYDMSSEDMAQQARFLAKMGVNMVRLHTQIAPAGDDSNLTDVNPKELDAIFRAVAAFKKEGIYVTLSPYWARELPASHWGIDDYTGTTDLWGLLFFNDTLQRGYKAWVKSLYTTPNPYTGITLAQDPAIAIIQVQNEDSLFFWTTQNIKPEQKRLLGEKFAQWAVKKYGSISSALSAWNRFDAQGDDPDSGRLGIMQVWEWTQPQSGGKAARLADQLQFFAEIERNFYTDIAIYYRNELGCRQLINGSNWITADPVRLGDAMRYADSSVDVLAVNHYYQGVHSGNNTGSRVEVGDNFTNNPAVLNPRELPTNLKQVVGHPMIITESSWENPMDYQSEGPFLMSAYESLTGVAGFYWFQTTADEYDAQPFYTWIGKDKDHPIRKWTCSSPALLGNFPAAALIYRKGYLQQGKPVVVENRSLNDLWQRRLPLTAESATYDPNRETGDRPAKASAASVDPLAFCVGPVLVSYSENPAPSQIADLSQFIDHDKKTVKSNTGEINLNYNLGLCTIDSPKAQGATGFMKQAGVVKLNDMQISCLNDHATIVAVSMDDQPLSQSHKILVQSGTRVRPTGWSEQPADFTWNNQLYHGFKILHTGSMPYLEARISAAITIRNSGLTHASWLFTNGARGGEVPITPFGQGVKITLPSDAMDVVVEGNP